MNSHQPMVVQLPMESNYQTSLVEPTWQWNILREHFHFYEIFSIIRKNMELSIDWIIVPIKIIH